MCVCWGDVRGGEVAPHPPHGPCCPLSLDIRGSWLWAVGLGGRAGMDAKLCGEPVLQSSGRDSAPGRAAARPTVSPSRAFCVFPLCLKLPLSLVPSWAFWAPASNVLKCKESPKLG